MSWENEFDAFEVEHDDLKALRTQLVLESVTFPHPVHEENEVLIWAPAEAA